MPALLDILNFPWRRRQKLARKNRNGVTKEDFVAALAADPEERRAASLLWDLLVEAAVIEDFRPLPDDDFLRLYGLAEEDLEEDIILKVLEAAARAVPPPATVRELGEISTPARLLALVRAAPPRRDAEPGPA